MKEIIKCEGKYGMLKYLDCKVGMLKFQHTHLKKMTGSSTHFLFFVLERKQNNGNKVGSGLYLFITSHFCLAQIIL